MKRIEIANIYKSPEQFGDKEITVCGWVRTQRASKAIGFLEINDGGCFKCLQVVFEEDKVSNFAEISKLNVGSSLYVSGKVVLTPEMRQPFEIHAQTIEIEGESPADYPFVIVRRGGYSVRFGDMSYNSRAEFIELARKSEKAY